MSLAARLARLEARAEPGVCGCGRTDVEDRRFGTVEPRPRVVCDRCGGVVRRVVVEYRDKRPRVAVGEVGR